MPIKHLQQRRRFLRLGKIRLGITVPVLDKKTGKPKMRDGEPVTMPKATDYFVVPDEVADALRDYQPKSLNISFLFESEEDTFPQFLKMYRGDGQLRCMGDGEMVYFRRFFDKGRKGQDPIDEVLIDHSTLAWGDLADAKDKILSTWGTQYGAGAPEEWNETKMRCLGEDCPQFGPKGCRATGRLLFKLDEIDRLGFWELTVHQHAIIGINSQLDLCRAFTRQYLGRATILHVPFKMHLRGPVKMKIGDYLATVYTPEIEPDPKWVSDVVHERFALPALEAPVSVEDIYGPDGRDKLPEPKSVEVVPEDMEDLEYLPGAEDDQWPDWADDHEGEPPIAPDERKAAPDADTLRIWIHDRVNKGKGWDDPVTEKQVGLLNGLLTGMFGKDEMAEGQRHQFLDFMFGTLTSKTLTKGQASALIDWAKDGEGYEPHPVAVAEGQMAIRAHEIAAGQTELPTMAEDD